MGLSWVTQIGLVVLALLIIRGMARQARRRAWVQVGGDSSSRQIILAHPPMVAWLGTGLAVLGLGLGGFVLGKLYWYGAHLLGMGEIVLIAGVSLPSLVVGAWLLACYYRERVGVSEDGLQKVSWYGRTQTLHWRELKTVRFIYVLNSLYLAGKRGGIRISAFMEGMPLFVSLAESKLESPRHRREVAKVMLLLRQF